MIGDGWDNEPSIRPSSGEPRAEGTPRRIAVVTGSRAEFGLLRPVMTAIHQQGTLELAVIAAGSHLILPAETFREVKAHFKIADIVPMQIAGKHGREEDVESVARGLARFGRTFQKLRPDWVVVLGDRIEAFAAAAAASIGGFPLAHIHGGDRAEGVADEAMRHAITKLAHLHFPATAQSADRLRRMGERAETVIEVGSPAVDGLADVPNLPPSDFQSLGSPTTIFLMHPIGRSAEVEEADAARILAAMGSAHVLALAPNHDAGRTGIAKAISEWGGRALEHLPRDQFVGLLKYLAATKGVLIGNSSAGLIEAAVLGVPVVDIGRRQAGRERTEAVIHIDTPDEAAIRRAIAAAQAAPVAGHPYGDGHAGKRIAAALARTEPGESAILRKRNSY